MFHLFLIFREPKLISNALGIDQSTIMNGPSSFLHFVVQNSEPEERKYFLCSFQGRVGPLSIDEIILPLSVTTMLPFSFKEVSVMTFWSGLQFVT